MKKIVFTAHAKDRCLEYGLNYRLLKERFKNARRTTPPKETIKKNIIWHNDKYAQYRFWNGVLYTYIVRGNAYIVMTITPKKREDVDFL